MPKMSMNEVTTFRWSFIEDVIAFSKAGLDGIGVWRNKIAEFGEERAVELLREYDLSVSSLSWAGGFTGTNGYSYREMVDDARDAIRLAGDMRAACLVLISGGRNGHTVNHSRRLLCEALAELGDFAAEHQVELALQPSREELCGHWSFLSSIDHVMDILDACDHPYVGMAFDTFHLAGEADIVSRIGTILPYVNTVQLSDSGTAPRTLTDRVMLGDGRLPLVGIIDAFERGGYDGFFDVGIWSDRLWQSNYDRVIDRCRVQFDRLLLDAAGQKTPQAIPSK
ncbi:sugar phosphate isomerase/epimerase family protein [Symmachiella dynata]|uniref:Xylose isomerase-like TIM barrel n=1 Tax=Symmachiella dynata TaxID=2527995 RepID=A0A517ZJ72_9PLAN|nr:sugar phosphate isomerase/epimerase family protein [Symmachiella dynata]QDU42528.1 Xylose isomerase-like TIM barrel [Symmachiella dynata]|tara:strand:- start:109 stop:954 length:846 start_codon:yes stop_codon:yes gene_type:complete